MFARIAPSYDRLNSVMSAGRHRPWRQAVVAGLDLAPGDSALDVCCGTGDFLVALARDVGGAGRVVGVDFALPMLGRAQAKCPQAGLLLGDACQLPVAEGAFDAVTIGWGIRNVADVDQAHAEVWRVLKPGGRFASIDMARPRNRWMAAWSGWLFRRGVPLLGALFGQREAYEYLPRSTETFMTRECLADSMRAAGFVDVEWSDLWFGNLCVHRGRKS